MKRLILNFFLWLFRVDYRFVWLKESDGKVVFIPIRVFSVPDLSLES